MDAETGEPMPLVSIVFVGTTIGVTTDFDGNYDIETREEVSEIMASFVSYERQTVAIKKGAFNTIDFKLVPIVTHLDEVKVKPEIIRLMRSCGIFQRIRKRITRPRRNRTVIPLIRRWNWILRT